MTMPNREGRFRAKPLEVGVSETGKDKLTTVVIRNRLLQELVPTENGQQTWVDVSGENMEITGYHYLEKTIKKDGVVERDPQGRAKTELNTRAIEDLKAAFGWDGRSTFWLQDNCTSLPEYQVELGWDTYNGQQRIRVNWIYSYDSEGGGPGVPKASEAERKAIAMRMDSKLRALAGGAPAATPPKPATKPAAPPAATKPPARGAAKPPSKPAPPPATATMEEAWEAFCTQGQEQGAGGEEIQTAWFDQIEALRDGATPDNLTPEEWGKLKAQGYRSPLKL